MTAETKHEGSMSTWQAAYDSHGRSIFAYLISRVGRDQAEDLLQETFVRAIRSSSLRDPQKMKAYLMSTAHNLLISRARKQHTLTFSELADANDQAPRSLEQGAEGGTDDRAALAELSQRLEGALGSMSDDHRRAFEMAILQQVSYAEISETTGWSASLVKVNVHRARKKAIQCLADYRPGDPGRSTGAPAESPQDTAQTDTAQPDTVPQDTVPQDTVQPKTDPENQGQVH